MSEFQPLIDQLFREEILRARKLGPQGRLREWVELAEMNLEAAAALGQTEMERRYRIVRHIEDYRCYGPPVPRR